MDGRSVTIKMNGGYRLLELAVRDILCVINPTKEDWTLRYQIIQELRSIVEPVESLKAGFFRVQFIPTRDPILKFGTGYNISCNIISINNCGQMKSKMLFWLNRIDGRFRDLVLLVKEWAKSHNINDSKSGTFDSYCLSLVVVFHLQTLVPAILPPLREIYPSNLIYDIRGVRADVEKQIEETCSVNIKKIKSDTSRLLNRSTVAQLFFSFFAKFADICSRAPAQGVNLYTGKWEEDINTKMTWLSKTHALFVEDPFEQPANTARTVSEYYYYYYCMVQLSDIFLSNCLTLLTLLQDFYIQLKRLTQKIVLG